MQLVFQEKWESKVQLELSDRLEKTEQQVLLEPEQIFGLSRTTSPMAMFLIPRHHSSTTTFGSILHL